MESEKDDLKIERRLLDKRKGMEGSRENNKNRHDQRLRTEAQHFLIGTKKEEKEILVEYV